ncbi:MAG: ABC transporter ATP-binding protein [Candidatus Omnitrophota bacterium]
MKNRTLVHTIRSLYKDVVAILSYSARILTKYKNILIRASIFHILSFPLGLSLIYITKATLDKGILASNMRLFFDLSLLGAAIFLVERGFKYFSGVSLQKAKAAFSTEVNYDLAKRLFGLEYLKIRELSTAENAFILNYDYRNIENVVFSEVPSLLSVIKIPIFFVLAAKLSLPLTALVFISVPFVAVQAQWASRKKRRYRMSEFHHLKKHTSSFHDTLLNIKLVKSLSKEEWALKKTDSLFRKRIAATLRSALFFLRSNLLGDIISRLNILIFGLAGGYLIITGRLSLGSFSAVSMYAYLIVSELFQAGSVVEELSGERMSLKRCASFIKDISSEEEKTNKGLLREQDFDENIELKDITFGYNSDRTIFEKISFVAPARKWTLLRGSSGEGKTTLLGLLLGLFPPREGAIHLGDKDLRSIERTSFSENVSVVHQEPYLFNDTMANNILLGEKKQMGDIEIALFCAKVDEVADGLLLGYNTRIGEAGSFLSGGQRQRIAIARALAREPRVLILDEATSFIDTDMEEEVFRNIRNFYPRLTVIFVTHRDTAVKYADEIAVLEKGKLVEVNNIPIN